MDAAPTPGGVDFVALRIHLRFDSRRAVGGSERHFRLREIRGVQLRDGRDFLTRHAGAFPLECEKRDLGIVHEDIHGDGLVALREILHRYRICLSASCVSALWKKAFFQGFKPIVKVAK